MALDTAEKMNDSKSRNKIRYPVSIQAIIDAGGETISATTTNISQQGIGIEALKSIPPGTPATIALNMPESITIYGNVMWSRHTLVNNLDAYQMGIEVFAVLYEGRMVDDPVQQEEVVQAVLAKAKEISQ